MIQVIPDNQYTDRGLSVFDHNLHIPRHRWYEFKEGFSESLVREAIESLSVKNRKVQVLDPFAGSGTTLVAAGRLGQGAVGIEVNPFLAFAARAKCAPNGTEQAEFQHQVDVLLEASKYEMPSPLLTTA
jgi:tRNA/tmRNA/rRNA uracil-C5-methylase (TrmA/RlmC/RlmD family)